MDLPSFLWLWKIAAWSMGFVLVAYGLLAISGVWMFYCRTAKVSRPVWLRTFHYLSGIVIVSLVLLLLAIGLVGTLGYYGSLSHSPHLIAGVLVVGLVFLSAWSATQIGSKHFWARSLHIATNITLFGSLIFVSLTGWQVVQKYLP
ncbi:DUF4079 domain-containing protein [Pleurocapsales cyanobacterium LEGE 06147]|nr:DUF4079 domain-containing protein [Pleurocapsales cyanobacterium LEGE 06147]